MRRLLLLAFGSALSAQTFIVDAANGPGTHYTQISAATVAVPDGSTLLIRPGNYDPFVIDAKGLTLLGGAGVDIGQLFTWVTAIEIKNTGPAQSVVLRGFQFATFYAHAWVHDCAGPVHVEDVALGVTYFAGQSSPGVTWRIDRSVQVMLRDCNSWSGFFWDSNVTVEGCTFDGYGSICALGSCSHTLAPALTLWNGTTQIVGCTLTGGSGGGGYFSYPIVANEPAIEAINASVRILAPTTVAAPATFPFIPDVQAITGTGHLRIDPGVVVTSTIAPAIAQTLTTQTAPMPSVRGVSTTPGSTLSASALGPVGNVSVLVLGFPGPAAVVLGVTDEFWIDPSAYLFTAFGVPQAGTPITGTVAVPANPAFVGLRLAWQSVSAGAGGLQASNPTWTLVY